MDPRLLFPVLAVLFAVLAGWSVARARHVTPAARAWTWLAVILAAVSAWLHAGA